MLSFAPSASKPHDKGVKGEQNPRYSHYNGLMALAHVICNVAFLRTQNNFSRKINRFMYFKEGSSG
jgi:hypothetical protein